MNKTFAAYIATALLILAMDGLWLGFLAKDFYQHSIGHLMAANPRWLPALLFYGLYPLGLLYFAILPQSADTGLAQAALRGALFGFFAYGTYDLSNLATLKDWPALLSVVDVVWGTVVSCLAAVVGKLALDRL